MKIKMRWLLALAGMLFPLAPAWAAYTPIMPVSFSSWTASGLAISSAPATSVVVDTAQQYTEVCVQNMDTSAALYCGDTVNVSSITTNGLLGVVIPPAVTATTPAQPTCFPIVQGMNFWCRSGSVTASTRAGIVRAK